MKISDWITHVYTRMSMASEENPGNRWPLSHMLDFHERGGNPRINLAKFTVVMMAGNHFTLRIFRRRLHFFCNLFIPALYQTLFRYAIY